MNNKKTRFLSYLTHGFFGTLLTTGIFPAYANNTVTTLDVENAMTVFSTSEAKTHSLPSCISSGNEQKWASLLSADFSTFDFLSIAKRSQQPVEVISSNSCESGVEAIDKVYINYPYTESVVPKVASNVNFIARTQVTMAEGEAAPTVAFELTGRGIKTVTEPDSAGLYFADFGELTEGRYTLITRVTSSDASETVEQHAVFDVEHVNITDVYQQGDTLYLQLPATHGSQYISLVPNSDGSYTVTTLDEAQWNSLFAQLTLTDYQIDFGDFSGDSSQDFLLTSTSGQTITIAQSTDGYVDATIIEEPANPESPTAPALASAPTSGAVGETIGVLTPGEFRVDESGAATYSIPLSLPQGIAGVTPSVSLNYSSAGGNGPLGKGWNIGGQSAITRCRQVFEQDGVNHSLTLTNDDRFCLNGQKLLKVSTGDYGENTTEYRTEIDSQTRVISYGSAGNGPAYFTVERADGSISYYGNSDIKESRSDSYQSTGDGTIIVWNLSSVSDNLEKSGNSIYYYYQTGTASSSDIGENEQVLTSIVYSGNEIEFDYKDNSSRQDIPFGFVSGKEVTRKAQLDKIIIRNHSSEEIRRYVLGYETDPYTAIERINKIQECVDSSCIPAATEFTWYDENAKDVTNRYGINNSRQLQDNTIVASQPFDLNGDGFNDLVYVVKVSGHYEMNVSYNNRGTFQESIQLDSFSIEDNQDIKIYPVDFDGDSHVEIVYYKAYAGKNYWYVYDLDDPTISVIENERTGRSYTSSSFDKNLNINTSDTGTDVLFHDINADALPDMLFHYNNSTKIAQNVGGLLASAKSVSLPVSQPVSTKTCSDSNYSGFCFHNSSRVNLFPTNIAPGDFNGDGVADIAVRIADVYSDLNQKWTFTYLYWQAYTLQEQDGEFSYVALDKVSDSYQKLNSDDDEFVHVGDLNGDGLGDLIYQRNTSIYHLYFGTGIGFHRATLVMRDSNGNLLSPDDVTSTQIIDVNKDGQSDFIYFSKTDKKWLVKYQDNGSFEDAETIANESDYKESEDSVMLGDWDADGYIDIGHIDFDDRVFYYRKTRVADITPGNTIYKITNGFGLETTIDYEQLTDTSVYTKGQGAEDLDYGRGSPVFDIISPQFVVSQVTSDAPSYVNDTFDSSNTVSVSYRYEALRAQAGGRGMLGFEKLMTTDNQTRVTTTTSYHQDFPYIGMPKDTLVQNDAGDTLSYAVNSWQQKSLHGGVVVYPYLRTSTENNYSVNSGNSVTQVSKVVTTNSYGLYGDSNDNHANLTKVVVDTYEGTSTTALSTVTTDNVYDVDDEPKWWLGRITNATVTHERIDDRTDAPVIPDIVRSSSFGYYAANHANEGMLKTESVNGLTTLHCYDDWGNETTTISHANVGAIDCSSVNVTTEDDITKVFRRKVTEYDSNGRFVVSQGNDKFASLTTINARNGYGQPTQTTDINGVKTNIDYDTFGRQYFTSNSLGQKSVVSRSSDTTSFSGSYYVETVTSNGKPTVKTYFNKLGQKIAVKKQAFDGQWIVSESHYDQHGRVISQSTPAFANAQTWDSFTYDIYGRITDSSLASGVTTEVDYSGLSVTTTVNPNDNEAQTQVKTETKNALGELTSVEDNAATNAGSTIRYYYNATGNLTKVIGIDNVEIVTGYDNYGRKTSMNDPDKGVWSYQHNALGELVLQSSARGYTTRNYRDSVGRMKTKQTRDGTDDNSPIVDTIDYVYDEHRLSTESHNSQVKSYFYDSFGRANKVQTLIDNTTTYTQQTTFDQYGRVFQQFDPAQGFNGCFNSSGSVVGSCRGIQNHYNTRGYLYKQTEARDSANGLVYQQITEMDALGNVKRFSQNNGAIASIKDYDTVTGFLKTITAESNGVSIQDNVYTFDALGNLRSRTNNTLKAGTLGQSESFGYDDVNRLTTVNGTEVVSYYENGNIKWKQGLGHYCYAGTGPHAVTGIGSGENCSVNEYQYDDNGNMTSGRGRSIQYSYFDKASRIENTQDNSVTFFSYGTNNSRYKRVTTEMVDGQQVTTTTYYVGNVEVISKSNTNVVTTRRSLPGAIELRRSNGTQEINYLLTDHLGSIDTIADVDGNIKEKLYFDVWGKKTVVDSANVIDTLNSFTTLTLAQALDLTTRGYTGHESVDHADIIHMNGRIYDPTLGRFLQADPIIQAPSDSQSYNRYAYVRNNPLTLTDPSGYSWWSKTWKKIRPYVGLIVAAIGTYICGGNVQCGQAGYALVGAASGAAGAAANGGNVFTGALRGAFTAMAFYQVGEAFSQANCQSCFSGGELTTAATVGKIAAHAMVGGITSVLQGGKFGHGFLAAGVAQGFAKSINGISSARFSLGRIMAAAVVGGTVSKLTGGKFANGATTGAFSRMFNDEAHYLSNRKAALQHALAQSKKVRDFYNSGEIDSEFANEDVGAYVQYSKDGYVVSKPSINYAKGLQHNGGLFASCIECAQGSENMAALVIASKPGTTLEVINSRYQYYEALAADLDASVFVQAYNSTNIVEFVRPNSISENWNYSSAKELFE
ncbi:RHS repeat-associated core domain-containing protein [Thalassotalea insulae]|nr:FG-GAP-like repeat-containing protein [Thalassotalea insulae]